ncbi:GPI anchored serine-threonine rich family protein [Patescibacteria group bacterium]|nr:GPI anchored serine-threonine rich family protein [Patescibacteria group bacterium]
MKKTLIIIFAALLIITPLAVKAALTESQIQSVLSLLQAFGVDSATRANTESALRGQSFSGTPSPSATTIPSGFRFNNDMSPGSRITDVTYMKIILAQEGCFNSSDRSNYFDSATTEAVKCFKMKYRNEISSNAGYAIGITELVAGGTREKLNQLLSGGTGCAESNWLYSLYPATCPTTGYQTKNWTKTGSCTGGVSHPYSELVSCDASASAFICTESHWFYSVTPAGCPSSGQQTKTWTKIGTCDGGVSHPATEIVSCSGSLDPANACTDSSWSYSLYPTTCPSSGQQTKTWTKIGNCTGGVDHSASETILCSTGSNNSCTNVDWSYILSPASCPSSGQQTKAWTKIGSCDGGVSHSAYEITSCNSYVPACTSFTYSGWSSCSSSGVQTRTVSGSLPSGCQGGNPLLSQSCLRFTVISPNGGEMWQAGSNQAIIWSATAASQAPYMGIYLCKKSQSSSCSTIASSTPNDGSYIWTIPTTTLNSADYIIHVGQTIGAFDESNAAFSIANGASSLSVVSPNGGEVWPVGSAQNITWNKGSITDNYVNIELWVGNAFFQHIALNAPNNGSYAWTLPSYLLVRNDYKIRITAYMNSIYDSSDSNFTISSATCASFTYSDWGTCSSSGIQTRMVQSNIPSGCQGGNVLPVTSRSCPITVTYPNGGEALEKNTIVGKTYTITWSKNGSTASTVRIELYRKGVAPDYYYHPYSTVAHIIAYNAPNSGSYAWTIPTGSFFNGYYYTPLSYSDDYYIKIADSNGESDFSNNDFSINTVTTGPPLPAPLAVNHPSQGEVVGRGTDTIRWNILPQTTSNVKIELFSGDTLYRTLSALTPNDGLFEWTPTGTAFNGNNYKIRVSDVDNPTIYSYSGVFTVSLAAITVVSPNGGEIWQKWSKVSINWMVFGSVNSVKIELYKGTDWVDTIASSLSASAGTYIWTVPSYLMDASNYKVRISDISMMDEIKDYSDGNISIH